jgi:hypothetical protein
MLAEMEGVTHAAIDCACCVLGTNKSSNHTGFCGGARRSHKLPSATELVRVLIHLRDNLFCIYQWVHTPHSAGHLHPLIAENLKLQRQRMKSVHTKFGSRLKVQVYECMRMRMLRTLAPQLYAPDPLCAKSAL